MADNSIQVSSMTVAQTIAQEFLRQAQEGGFWVGEANDLTEIGIDGHFDLEKVAAAVSAEILAPLLEYEGGELQSMAEQVGCSNANDRLIRYAGKLGVTFSEEQLAAVGRRKR